MIVARIFSYSVRFVMIAKDKQKLRHFLSLYLRWSELRATVDRSEDQERNFIVLYVLLEGLTSKQFMEAQ